MFWPRVVGHSVASRREVALRLPALLATPGLAADAAFGRLGNRVPLCQSLDSGGGVKSGGGRNGVGGSYLNSRSSSPLIRSS